MVSNSYSITGLSPDQTYSFKVTADYGAAGQAADPSAVTATAISSQLTASGSSTMDEGSSYTLNLSSDPIDGLSWPITSWQIDWHDGAWGGSDLETVTGSSGSSQPHTFPAGTTASRITITAFDSHGNSFSLPASEVAVVPAAPTGLTATVYSRNQIDLSWTDNSQMEDGFTILRSDDGGSTFNVIGTVDANVTTYSDTTLDPSTPYQYQVDATGPGSGDGGSSTTSSAATSGSRTTDSGMPTTSAPQAGTVSVQGGSVTLSWSYEGQDAAAFEIEMEGQVTGENYHLVDTLGGGSRSDTISGIMPSEDYSFRMRVDYTDGN